MELAEQNITLDAICKLILSIDKAINFVAIVDERGRALESRTRDSVYFNLPEDKREIFFMEFALRQRMRSEFDEYFGPVRFTYAERGKEVMLSFPLGDLLVIVSCKMGVNPKSLAKKILYILNAKEKLDLIDTGDHVLRIYEDAGVKMNDALEFLKAGLDRNETVMLLTDDLSKDKIRERMSREWNINVKTLETKDQIILKTVHEWYNPIDSFEAKKIMEQWIALVEFVKMKGRCGLRVFEDTAAFFKGGFSEKLIRYESTLPKKSDIPLTIICAYKKKDMDNLSLKQYNILRHHHSI